MFRTHALAFSIFSVVTTTALGLAAGAALADDEESNDGAVRLVASIPVPGSATTAAATAGLQGKIVFRRFLNDAHSHGALFVMNADGTGIREITHPPADAVDSLNGPPSATPDGATLVFDRSTPSAAGIFRVGLNGRGEREPPPGLLRGPDLPGPGRRGERRASAVEHPGGPELRVQRHQLADPEPELALVGAVVFRHPDRSFRAACTPGFISPYLPHTRR